ncbi:MAG: c-type cytochrome [Pseudomonadota bacterium]
MTDKNTDQDNAAPDGSSGDLLNTAAGWVLFAGVVGLGFSILSSKYFHGYDPERPEQLGYVIEGVVEEGPAKAEMTMAEALTLVTAQDGEKVYAKCAACHTLTPGGANGVGPNLNAIMGANVAAKGGYTYSSALQDKGGAWGWEEMNLWLKNPKQYVEGTKMGFAGLSKIEDRAAVALFMNEAGSNLPLPEFTPAEVEEALPVDGEEVEPEVPVAEDAEGPVTEAAAE